MFEALAEGRVHLSGLVLLAKHLEPGTAGDLLAAAAHKTKAEIEQLIAERFPRQELAARVESIPPTPFDHVQEFARGGEATVANLRLRCRGHNQHTAEQTYGAGFMRAKREEAQATAARMRAAREEAKATAATRRAEREKQAEESRLQPHELEVIPWLRQLGCREDESRIAARRCRDMPDASLEDRVKRALSWFGARLGRKEVPVTATTEGSVQAEAQSPAA